MIERLVLHTDERPNTLFTITISLPRTSFYTNGMVSQAQLIDKLNDWFEDCDLEVLLRSMSLTTLGLDMQTMSQLR